MLLFVRCSCEIEFSCRGEILKQEVVLVFAALFYDLYIR